MWISPRGSVWRLYVAGVVFSNRRVERTSYTQAASVEDMGVDHGDAHVGVPEELLDRPDVVSGFEQVSGEGVSEGMALRRFGDPRGAHRALHGPLENRLVEMVSATLTCLRVPIEARGREDPLPGPVTSRAGVLPAESVGQLDVSGLFFNVLPVLEADSLDVSGEGCFHLIRKNGDSVLSSLSVSNQDLIPAEIDILNPQARTLQHSQSGPIEKRRHEPWRPVKLLEDCINLVTREH